MKNITDINEIFTEGFDDVKYGKEEKKYESLDFIRREMKVFHTTYKVHKTLEGHSSIEKNNETSRFLCSRYYKVGFRFDPIFNKDCWSYGRIMKSKKIIKIKDCKQVNKDICKDGDRSEDIVKYVAGDAGISKSALKYCR
ncbi:16416_t:CDS:2 [Dentiscutata erythropus]|uniref:16416_t:CDS:1 n=1 Tax=Dentiscutata erythropus TaxID=1348616 RepID=A0A9N9HVR7_9GLOM|nr:16416_t:CDS:2 [Dentiscutata erythropus]